MLSSTHPLQARRPWSLARWCAAWLFGLALTVLVSCGGGGGNTAQNNNGGIGSGGTGSYTSGPVTGLGSIIVNGIEYSTADVSTTVIDDQGQSTTAGVKALLKIGMVVEVLGSTTSPATVQGQPDTATATQVRYSSLLTGQITAVGAVDASTGRPASITVLGQIISVDAKTRLPAGGLAVNNVVEVHGLMNGSNAINATLIERLNSLPATQKLTGALLSVSGQTFTLGQAGRVVSVNYLGSTPLPDGMVPGAVVKVWLDQFTAGSGSSAWAGVATSPVRIAGVLVSDSTQARLNGEIQSVSLSTHRIRINRVTVDTTTAIVRGTSVSQEADLREDQRVVVNGVVRNGVLVATTIDVLSQAELEQEDVELRNAQVSSLDAPQGTFIIQNVVVNYTNAQINGTLRNGACAEVKGRSYNAQNQLVATEVEVETSCRPD